MNAAVILDSQKTLGIRNAVIDHMIHLPGWELLFFHGANNGDYVKERLKGIKCKFVRMPEPSFPWPVYNKILTSVSFWELLAYFDKVLMFHPDSGILKPGINDFVKWDYVGAPWSFQQHGGNGGFSLRTPKVMLDIVSLHVYRNNQMDGNEDIWFSNIMYGGTIGKLAPRSVCAQFSVESIFQLGTFGFHGIQKWLNPEQVKQIMTQYDNN